MIFRYAKGGRSLPKKSLLVAMGIVAIPLSLHVQRDPVATAKTNEVPAPPDPRVTRLQRFLSSLHCPVAGMAEDFVRQADQNHLDWRLLPSIAIIESGGGKAYKNNNIFGWDGGEQAFATIRSGMELVAYRLAHSPLYRNRNSFAKLRVYNENQEYADSVMSVMRRISPTARLRPIAYEATRAADERFSTQTSQLD